MEDALCFSANQCSLSLCQNYSNSCIRTVPLGVYLIHILLRSCKDCLLHIYHLLHNYCSLSHTCSHHHNLKYKLKKKPNDIIIITKSHKLYCVHAYQCNQCQDHNCSCMCSYIHHLMSLAHTFLHQHKDYQLHIYYSAHIQCSLDQQCSHHHKQLHNLQSMTIIG